MSRVGAGVLVGGAHKERGGQRPEPMVIGAGGDTTSVGSSRQPTASAPRDEYLQLLDELLAPVLALSPPLSPSLSLRGLQAAAPGAAGGEGRACEPVFL